MPLTSGTRLGPYEVLAPLGAGGMGEVYRARDTRLGREVAIKVLPQHLSSSPEVRARFEREAKTVSSLNHPHICSLFDLGREGDTDFLVMELVEGETLARRIAKSGPLPVPQVLELGAQIADALERAHRAGIVHRDLKPGNVMLSKTGAKLMDFGLARATEPAGTTGGSVITMAASQSPTVAQPLTAEGSIVGTLPYMAPEQLDGKESDARTDIWALGCVLYEMATGQRAFDSVSQASLIAAIIKDQPRPIGERVPMTPPALERLVNQCLAKDPDERWQTAGDLRRELLWIAGPDSGSVAAGGTAVRAKRGGTAPIAWAIAAAVAALLATQTVLNRSAPRAPAAPERYAITSADFTGLSTPAFSPDGSYIVFSVRDGQDIRLYRRDLASFTTAPIAGTEGGFSPFFSPDGTWLAFLTKAAIRKVPAGGGPSQVIHNESRLLSATWGADGQIYYSVWDGGADRATAVSRVPATGGEAVVTAVLDTAAGESGCWVADMLPDGKTLLVSIRGADPEWKVVAVGPDGSRHVVVNDGVVPHYSASGKLLYVDGQSFAVLGAPFDAGSAKITGPAVPLTEKIDLMFGIAASGDDKLAYVPAEGAGMGAELAWMDRKGNATPITDVLADWVQPRLSPDGTRLLARKVQSMCELWQLDLDRGTLAEIAHGRDNEEGVWSPDGRRIAYFEANVPMAMVTRTVAGPRDVKTLESGPGSGEPQSWSRGGNLLVYSKRDARTRSDIWVLPMDGASRGTPFLATEADEASPAISPDGRWIAYSSDESGTSEVYVRAYPDDGHAWQVSAGGGISPVWSRDGRELYFIAGTSMMAVPVATQPTLNPGRIVRLFDGGFNTSRLRNYDVAPDGRFVVVRTPGGAAGLPEMRMVLHWAEEMRRVAGEKQ